MKINLRSLFLVLNEMEETIPRRIRKDLYFCGIRVGEDRSGRFLSICRTYSDDKELSRLPKFKRAMRKNGLAPGKPDPLSLLVNQKCYAGNLGYASTTGPDNADTPRGTLGWFFILDGTPVCVSNYHVFCFMGNRTKRLDTNIYWQISQGNAQEIGQLLDYDPKPMFRRRVFDFALAKITNLTDVAGTFAPNVGTAIYPKSLWTGEEIDSNDIFFTVGAETNSRKSGKFLGVGSRRITAGDPFLYEQLFFTPMTASGDSGSVVVHERTGTVIGLVVAGGGAHTIANPLYRKPWIAAGTQSIAGVVLPNMYSRLP